jgi:hypothetical protein
MVSNLMQGNQPPMRAGSDDELELELPLYEEESKVQKDPFGKDDHRTSGLIASVDSDLLSLDENEETP